MSETPGSFTTCDSVMRGPEWPLFCVCPHVLELLVRLLREKLPMSLRHSYHARPSPPTAFKPSTLRDCNYACLLGLGLCTSRLQFSRFLEYGCTVLYNGVLSMRTRLLKPCAAQICCSDGVLKNVLCMSECLGGSSDCI